MLVGASSTSGFIAGGGYHQQKVNTIEFVTIATTSGNTTDFGDLTYGLTDSV